MKIEQLLDDIMPKIEEGTLSLQDEILVTENMVLTSQRETEEELEEDMSPKEALFDDFANEVISKYSSWLTKDISLMVTVEIERDLIKDIYSYFENVCIEDLINRGFEGLEIRDFRDKLLELIHINITNIDGRKSIKFFKEPELHDFLFGCEDCESLAECQERLDFEVRVCNYKED